MSVALHLYQQLQGAPDEDSRAKIIATAFEQLEDRYPNLKNVATQADVRESELRLQKEIMEVSDHWQVEMKQMDYCLQKEIHQIKLKIKDPKIVHWIIGVAVLQTSLLIGVILKVLA